MLRRQHLNSAVLDVWDCEAEHCSLIESEHHFIVDPGQLTSSWYLKAS